MVRIGDIDLVSLSQYAPKNNFKTMASIGISKVLNGTTSFDEIVRVMYDQI